MRSFLCFVSLVCAVGVLSAGPVSLVATHEDNPRELYLILYNQSDTREVVNVGPEAFRFLLNDGDLAGARGPISDTKRSSDELCVLDPEESRVFKFMVVLEGESTRSPRFYIGNPAKTHFWMIGELNVGDGLRIVINDKARDRLISSNILRIDPLILKR